MGVVSILCIFDRRLSKSSLKRILGFRSAQVHAGAVRLKRRLQTASHKRGSASSLQITVRGRTNKANGYAAFFHSLVGQGQCTKMAVDPDSIAALLPCRPVYKVLILAYQDCSQLVLLAFKPHSYPQHCSYSSISR